MMKDMPFTVSPSAAALINERMRGSEANPELVALVPVVGYVRSMIEWIPDGRVIKSRDRSFYQIGWYDAHQAFGWDRFQIAGFELAVPPETLEMLRGHNLEVEVIEDKDRTSRYLIARKY